MTDNHTAADAQRVEHADDVADQLALRVRLDRRGRFGLAVAALVGRDRAEARFGNRLHLMPPRVPHLGKAVAKHHRKALAGLRHVHLDAVSPDEAVLDLTHRVHLEESGAGRRARDLLETA